MSGKKRQVDQSEREAQSLRLWLRLLGTSRSIEEEVSVRLRTRFESSLARFDLMSVLNRFPDGVTMSDLGRHLRVSGGNVTGLVDRLEREELVQRVAHATDRRSSMVVMTEHGQNAFKQMATEHRQWLTDIMAGLDMAQIDKLYDGLDHVRTSIAAEQERTSRKEAS